MRNFPVFSLDLHKIKNFTVYNLRDNSATFCKGLADAYRRTMISQGSIQKILNRPIQCDNFVAKNGEPIKDLDYNVLKNYRHMADFQFDYTSKFPRG